MNVGDTVRILEPFTDAFPGTYTVTTLDGTTTTLQDADRNPIDSAFDVCHLEVTS